ncbi:MAG: hypothetical protein ACOVQT_09990, partial [Rubrivivax sp.]
AVCANQSEDGAGAHTKVCPLRVDHEVTNRRGCGPLEPDLEAQLAVRRVRALEEPGRLVEESALELLATGRLRPHHERLADLRRVDAQDLQAYFASLLRHPMAVAATGRVRRGLPALLRQALDVPISRADA